MDEYERTYDRKIEEYSACTNDELSEIGEQLNETKRNGDPEWEAKTDALLDVLVERIKKPVQ